MQSLSEFEDLGRRGARKAEEGLGDDGRMDAELASSMANKGVLVSRRMYSVMAPLHTVVTIMWLVTCALPTGWGVCFVECRRALLVLVRVAGLE